VGHGRLDAGCRKISTDLGITLPNEASPQQQQFVATAEGSTGKEFESTAVTIMRVAHGGIFPTIAKIRATTRNSLVRELADTTNDTVLDHITVLEKTGLINQEQVSFQITAPPKMPQEQTTPPPPQQGAPVRVLPVPEELKDFQTVAPNPSYGAPAPSPSAGGAGYGVLGGPRSVGGPPSYERRRGLPRRSLLGAPRPLFPVRFAPADFPAADFPGAGFRRAPPRSASADPPRAGGC
jgi:hypothetical protein